MEENTETTETPVISFEQAKAILNVAYLLAAVDGVICEQEQAQFRALMKQLFGERYAEAEVMAYLEGVAEDARKLTALRAFYKEDDEIVRAFAAKAASSVAIALQDAYVIRCAFAIWISICCADKDYSKSERLAVKSLQQMVNPNAMLKSIKSHAGVAVAGAAVAGLFGFGLAVLPAVAGLAMSAAKTSKGISITDAFLSETEKRVKKIGEIYAKIEAAEDDDLRQNYKDMYDFEVENFKEFLEAK